MRSSRTRRAKEAHVSESDLLDEIPEDRLDVVAAGGGCLIDPNG